MTTEQYMYAAVSFSPGHWFVKRYDEHGAVTEAEVTIDTSDPQTAIDAAIQQGSWD